MNALLADDALRGRLDAVSRRLQANPGTARAADLLEDLARNPAPTNSTNP